MWWCIENCLECDGNKCSKCLDGYYPKKMECIKCNEKCKERNSSQYIKCEDNNNPSGMDYNIKEDKKDNLIDDNPDNSFNLSFSIEKMLIIFHFFLF